MDISPLEYPYNLDMQDDVNDSGEGLVIGPITYRSYLSTHHLYAAYFAAEQARHEEESDGVRSLSRLKHRGCVMSAVTESVCFLEAAINEVLGDNADGTLRCQILLGEESADLLRAIWRNGGDRLGILEKYNLVVEALGRGAFLKGARPYQDVHALIRLRNYLVHYKPHDNTPDSPHAFEKLLRGRFSDNTLKNGDNPWPSWFPYSALGAGCAEWAWRSARSFVEEFSAKLDMELNYHEMTRSFVRLPD